MKTWSGKHWLQGTVHTITTSDGFVTSLKESTEPDIQTWIAPGFIDVQLNGINGFDLNSPTVTTNDVRQVVEYLHSCGVTRFCPTVVTGTKERMLHCIRTIAEACLVDPIVNYAVIGIHVEGPFISPDDGPRGAHNKLWVRDPDWAEFEEWRNAAGNRICKVTLAPERPGAIEFIRRLAAEQKVVPAIGHCNATEEQITMAVEAGARMSTHLGNGAHPYIRRHPNYIWAQMADDRLWAGLIADGHHLPPSTLKVMIRSKREKSILTSDAVNLAGLPPGRYSTHINSDVILETNGFLHLAHTTDIMAGSATPLHICVQNVAKFGICSLGEAITMASSHPAKLFGLDGFGVGTIAEGSPADFVLYETINGSDMTILETVSNGRTVYRRTQL